MEYLLEHEIVGPLRCFQKAEALVFVWSNWSIVRRSLPTSLPVSKDVKRKQTFLLHVGSPAAQQISSLLLPAGAESMRERRLPHSSERLVGTRLHVMEMLHKDHQQAQTACFYEHHLPSIHRCFQRDSGQRSIQDGLKIRISFFWKTSLCPPSLGTSLKTACACHYHKPGSSRKRDAHTAGCCVAPLSHTKLHCSVE